MEIKISGEGRLDLLDVSISELRVIAEALETLQSEAGTAQAYASEVAGKLGTQIPAVIYNVPKYLCKQCRTNFYEDEIAVLEIGSRAERVEVCPCCESHLIERLPPEG